MNTLNSDPTGNANALRHTVSRLSRRLRYLRSEANTQSLSKLSILSLLMRAEAPTTIGELARQERLQPQTLTRLVADLEADGLIDRQVDPQDRRQLPIAITDAGRSLMVDLARQQNAWLGEAMLGFSETERGVIALAATLLERLAEFEPPK
jgi:DNA-binding MarR family transcriptional regulator